MKHLTVACSRRLNLRNSSTVSLAAGVGSQQDQLALTLIGHGCIIHI